MRTGTDDGSCTVGLGRYVGDVLATQDFSHITEAVQRRTLLLVFGHAVHRESLVMRYSKYVCIVHEGGVVDGGVVVKCLNYNFILICYPGVVHVDKPVGRSR